MSSNDSNARKATPTPRRNARTAPEGTESIPVRPVVDGSTSRDAYADARPSSERRPSRRGNTTDHDAGVKVIHTTTRDVREGERAAREADRARLAEAGSTAGASRGRRSRADGTPDATAPAAPAAKSEGENAEQGEGTGRQAERHRSKKRRPSRRRSGEGAGVSSRETAERVRGTGERMAGYARTHTRKLVVIAAILAALVSLYFPVRDYYVAWRRQSDLQAQYEQVQSNNEGLQSDVDRLQSREGIEDEARRHGYGYEGENTLSVEGIDEDDGNQGVNPIDGQETAQAEVPWYIHVTDFIFGYSSETSS